MINNHTNADKNDVLSFSSTLMTSIISGCFGEGQKFTPINKATDYNKVYELMAIVMGYNLGQCRGLSLCTRDEIADEYPLLSPFIYHQCGDYNLANFSGYYDLFSGLSEANSINPSVFPQ